MRAAGSRMLALPRTAIVVAVSVSMLPSTEQTDHWSRPLWWWLMIVIASATLGAVVAAGLGAWYYHDQRAAYDACVANGFDTCGIGTGLGASEPDLAWILGLAIPPGAALGALTGWGYAIRRAARADPATTHTAAFGGAVCLVVGFIPALGLLVQIFLLPLVMVRALRGYRESKLIERREGVVLAVVGGTLGAFGLVVSGLWVAVMLALAYG